MNNDFVQKKAWVSPSIEAAPVQITERIKLLSITEAPFTFSDPFNLAPLGGNQSGGDEPGGPS